MAKKCKEIVGCADTGDDACKCLGCPESFDCNLCFVFGCINHKVEEEEE